MVRFCGEFMKLIKKIMLKIEMVVYAISFP